MDSFTTKEVEKVIEKYGLRLNGDLKDTSFGTLRKVFVQDIFIIISLATVKIFIQLGTAV